MKKLFLVRHGTVQNPHGILYRRLPGFLLSELGRREVEETAVFLSTQPVETIYHSPLERAVETAEIIATYPPGAGAARSGRESPPMVVDERIHEWGEGESPDEVLSRMRAFLEDWRTADHEVSVAVSHRDPIRRLLFDLVGRPWPYPDDAAEMPLPQAGVYLISDKPNGICADLVFVPSHDPASPRFEIDKV